MTKKSLDLNVYKLKKSDSAKAVEVATRAFIAAEEPWIPHYFPSPENREKNVRLVFEFGIRYCMLYGEVYAPTPEIAAIAGVVYHKKFKPSLIKNLRAGLLGVLLRTSGMQIRKAIKLLDFCDKMHMKNMNEPHWEGALFATDPDRMGDGLYLAVKVRKKIDQIRVPFYLQTQNERNAAFYQKLGIDLIEKNNVPGTDLSIWDLQYRGKDG